ncbi:MAG: prephenate dehydrogenase [Pseudonocardiaceae bacterium]|nr:prephenate dehydrogenase [Pseudonocardiaceae bacterium]
MALVRSVCVIGLGLIGGSLLRAASTSGRTAWGAAPGDDASGALADGFSASSDLDEALRRAASEDALVVLAMPLPEVDGVLARVAELAPECRLSDVVSVKEPVARSVRRAVPGARYVGGHPMAGTSSSGWAAGSASLFDGAAWVTTVDERTELEVWRDVASLALDAGAHVVPVSTAEHDDAVARISHLPHVFAAVLAAVGADGGPLAMALAAGSFGDGTRVAGSNPELVRAMCEGNGTRLLSVVDDALGRLGAARGSLASTGSLAATLKAGHHGRQSLDAARAEPRNGVRVDLRAPDASDGLAAIGARGGRITALDGDIALGELP